MGVASLLQAVQVCKARDRHLAERLGLAIGEAGAHHAVAVYRDAVQPAGGKAVLRERYDGERIGIFGGCSAVSERYRKRIAARDRQRIEAEHGDRKSKRLNSSHK